MAASASEYEDGAFLTDGHRLYQVVRAWAPSGQVLLEDSGDPSRPALVKTVREMVADGFRVVRTEKFR